MAALTALRLVLKRIPRSSWVENCGIVWTFGGLFWESKSKKMGGVTDGEVLAFGGVEV